MEALSLRLEPRYVQAVRALAASAQRLVDGDAAAIIVFHGSDADELTAAYGPQCDRDGGVTTIGARFEPVLHGGVGARLVSRRGVSDLERSGKVAQPREVEYDPMTSAEVSLGDDVPLAALPLRDVDDDVVGLLIVRRRAPFSRTDLGKLASLVPAAAAAVAALPPTVRCSRCEGVVATPMGLVSFVGGEWIAGHKRCYSESETMTWFELDDVQEKPAWYTRVATTSRSEPDHLAASALRSWYILVETVTGQLTLPRDGAGEPIYLSGFTVTDDYD
jgi:hypothetical protein